MKLRLLNGRKHENGLSEHVNAGRGGLVELDELPENQCCYVALDQPATNLLRLAAATFKGTF